MLINNIDISTFKATQLTVDIQTSKLENGTEWIKGKLAPTFDVNYIGFKTIKIELCFEGTSRENVLINISNLMSIFLDEVVLKLDGYSKNYRCILMENETIKTVSSNVYKKTLTFSGYEFGEDLFESMNNMFSKTINVQGNIETPAIVGIKVSIDTASVTVTGFGEDFIVKNLKANTPVILNGEECIITQNGYNKFGDSEIWEFPKLQPGNNTITIDNNISELVIGYTPKYI